jgi:hypothetical protein
MKARPTANEVREFAAAAVAHLCELMEQHGDGTKDALFARVNDTSPERTAGEFALDSAALYLCMMARFEHRARTEQRAHARPPLRVVPGGVR